MRSIKAYIQSVLLVAILFSCITTEDISAVSDEYVQKNEERSEIKSDLVQVSGEANPLGDIQLKVIDKRHYVVPLILVNFYIRNRKMVIPEEWYINAFKEALISASDTLGLDSVLHSQNAIVEVVFTDVPDTFSLRDNVFITPYYAVGLYTYRAFDSNIRAKMSLTQFEKDQKFDYEHEFFIPVERDGWSFFYSGKDTLRWYLMKRDRHAAIMAKSMCDMLVKYYTKSDSPKLD